MQRGVLHANVGQDGDHAPYAPCTLDDLRAAGMDYWALGHVHRRRVVLDGTGGDPWAVYPGNLQGRSVRRTERGAKGASVVHVEDGAVRRVEHVVLDRARFDVVTVTIDDETTVGDVVRLLGDQAVAQAEQAGDRVLVLRADVDGAGPAHLDLAHAGARDGLLAALRDRVAGHDRVVVTGVRDRSAPPVGDLDPRLAALLDQLDEGDVVAPGLAVARDRGWSRRLPDDAVLTTAARTSARTLLGGDA